MIRMTDTVRLPEAAEIYRDYCHEKQLFYFQSALDGMSKAAKLQGMQDLVTFVSPSMYKKLLTTLGDK